jgi:histidinol dehydrogenase
VRSEPVSLGRDPAALAAELRALVPRPASVQDRVAEIVAQVRAAGDEALTEYTRRFDTAGGDPPPIVVTDAELDRAAAELAPELRAGLELAIENIRRVGEAGLRDDRVVEFEDHLVILRAAPVASAGVYVPGGRAPYPSTVAMGVVTALVAGVRKVAVCAPPGPHGEVNPVVLAACRLAGATVVYRMGGAQAVAALAFGTETVRPVDVIVGPGNLYVQEAKRQLSGQVGIDSFAGPTDLVAVATDGADIEALALDLLAQAEHGDGSLVIAISDSSRLLAELEGGVAGAPDTGAVLRFVHAHTPEAAVELAQALAPEHLQLAGPAAEALAERCTHAGAVFVGSGSGAAFGDYVAGSNHILPTNGSARFASALTPDQFLRRFTEVRIGDGSRLARAAAPLARAEGFEFHARSMEARIRDNEDDDANR